MAENLSALDYKTLEEVLTIIKCLTSVLSTSGTHIVESLCPSQLLAQLHSRPDGNTSDVSILHACIVGVNLTLYSLSLCSHRPFTSISMMNPGSLSFGGLSL
jgi:hypothetical protein